MTPETVARKCAFPVSISLREIAPLTSSLPIDPDVDKLGAKTTVASVSATSGTLEEGQQRPCSHCGLPTSIAVADDGPIFCCSGCEGAYQLIHGWGLDDYYALRDQVGSTSSSPSTGEKSRYDAFDSDAFLGLSTPQVLIDGSQSCRLAVHGLHCAACAWLIENAAARTEGWRLARVRMSDHTMHVVFDPQRVKLSQLARLLDRLGYTVVPLTKNPQDQFQRENRRLLTQIAIAGFCAANAMWIAVALYAGEASGLAAEHATLFRVIGTALAVVAVGYPGRVFFIGAFAALRMRTPHMDLPIALGLSVGAIAGTVNAVLGRGETYFDSLATLVFFLLIGRWIQFRQQFRAARSIDLLLRITPAHARRVRDDGSTEWVIVDAIQAGETVRVAAGESLPADGIVTHGHSMLDRSLLTGESAPLTVQPGETVAAGTVNLVQPIDVQVVATGIHSRIGKVMQAVELATAKKLPLVQLADRVGGIFVVVVTLLAIITLGYWAQHDWFAATDNATALLIVACPCALAMATPLAIAVSLGRAAKRKILIRDGKSFQLLARPGVVWFDKTGTLTVGRPEAQWLGGDRRALSAAAAIEQGCQHPIADALVRYAARFRLALPQDARMTRTVVGGIEGICENQAILIGSFDCVHRADCRIDPEFREMARKCLASGSSPVLIAVAGEVRAVLGISDVLKPESVQVVQWFRQRGWEVGILSGDHPQIVERVAQQLAIPAQQAYGALTPEEKLARVRNVVRGKRIVMIGDGANDAAALAAADVGIAVRGGAEVSLQAAPVFVASGKLSSIADLVAGSRRVSTLIITGFTVSLAYNLLAVSLAMAGKISPLLAAILMPLSSVSVITLVLTWPTFPRKTI